MEKYLQLSTILVFVALLGVGFTGYGVINAQTNNNTNNNNTEPTIVIPEGGTIDVYDKSFESYIGLALAIISLITAYLVRTGANNKYIQTMTQAKDFAEMIKQDRETRREGMQVVYEMLPEKAQEIVDRPKVRLSELDKDVGEATARVNSLTNIVDKFGKPKV